MTSDQQNNDVSDELIDQPVRAIAKAISSGQVSAAKVTRDFLDRIEAVNPALNAVVLVAAEHAMKLAERADIALKGGETPGPLFGVPMTIKDSLDTYDLVSTWGTTGRVKFRPGRDATCVARLRAAGAVLLGKTNTPEFTMSFQTDNLIFGKTNNPFALDRTSGGSSGGAASIIAAQASPFDVGTDTCGSIRLPSHFCGVAGIKPTTGRIPCTGNALPSTGLLAPLTQPGPMARYVDDLSYLLPIMMGPDNIDPHARLAPWYDPDAVVVQTLRIGYHADNGIKTPDAPIIKSLRDVIDQVNMNGLKTSEVRPSGLEMTSFVLDRLFSAASTDMLEGLIEDCRTSTPSKPVQRLLTSTNSELTRTEIEQTINLWHNYQSSMLSFFDDFDILICPVNAHTASLHETELDNTAYTYTSAYNLTGWPGVVIRAGTDELGLPIGVQIVAKPFREDHCLAMARWLESRLGPFVTPNGP